MAEFCPRCGTLVDASGDECRYCEACGWFGDNSETSTTPVSITNPICAIVNTLALFRKVCREELKAEQVYLAGNATEAELRKVTVEARNARHSLIELFTTLCRQP